ncbi:predicted protein [Histoplasma mississippiense (nom. inval.)]|uniref:predicted protein n=1 Tax=Ajellomyces capsulatus (strain NAm1 / WU24) TaxID=2059318 RepID=UPI000157D035|nr:predicted protein [Histoplasma mississippiense (nom. inval.)]EDN04242.1 predicted protein [Histoplasma mississippiense (nom. inval.)]
MLLKFGFYVSSYDAELFIHDTKRVYVTVYVNNVCLFSLRIKDLDWAKAEIAANYKIKDVGDSNCYLSSINEGITFHKDTDIEPMAYADAD